MEIASVVVYKIYQILDVKFELAFNKYLFPNLEHKVQFSDYFRDFIVDEISKQSDLKFFKRKVLDRTTKTKKRWLQSVIQELETKPSNPQYILEDVYFGKVLLEKSDIEKYRSYMNMPKIDCVEDIIPIILDELTEWANSTSTHLIDFKYINSYRNSIIISAFHNDLLIESLSIINRVYNNKISPEAVIEVTANTIFENPIFTAGVKNALFFASNDNDEGVVFTNEYYTGEDSYLKTSMTGVDKSNNVHYIKTALLDDKDLDLINYSFSKRDESFFTKDGMIRVDIGELASAIYGSQNGNSYTNVTKRIVKISNSSFSKIVKKDGVEIKNSTFKIFSHEIEKDPETGKTSAFIFFSTELKREFLEKKASLIYKLDKNLFKKPMCKLLIYSLQQEQIHSHLNQMQTQKWTYDFLRNRVRFNSKNVQQNMKLIKESLDEFVERKVILESFEVLSDGFLLNFFTLKEHEIADLIKSRFDSTIELTD